MSKKDPYNMARTCVYSNHVTERGINFVKMECPKARRIKNPRIKDWVYLVVAETCDKCEMHQAKVIKYK